MKGWARVRGTSADWRADLAGRAAPPRPATAPPRHAAEARPRSAREAPPLLHGKCHRKASLCTSPGRLTWASPTARRAVTHLTPLISKRSGLPTERVRSGSANSTQQRQRRQLRVHARGQPAGPACASSCRPAGSSAGALCTALSIRLSPRWPAVWQCSHHGHAGTAARARETPRGSWNS